MSLQGASLWEQFKSHYPRRNGRPLAGQAFAKRLFHELDETEQAQCVQAAKNYSRVCKGNGTDWIPEPRDMERFLRSKGEQWWRDWVQGPAVVCNFRMTPACPTEVVEGTETCAFHTAYRIKIEKLRA